VNEGVNVTYSPRPSDLVEKTGTAHLTIAHSGRIILVFTLSYEKGRILFSFWPLFESFFFRDTGSDFAMTIRGQAQGWQV
jgi:hypothetical protein